MERSFMFSTFVWHIQNFCLTDSSVLSEDINVFPVYSHRLKLESTESDSNCVIKVWYQTDTTGLVFSTCNLSSTLQLHPAPSQLLHGLIMNLTPVCWWTQPHTEPRAILQHWAPHCGPSTRLLHLSIYCITSSLPLPPPSPNLPPANSNMILCCVRLTSSSYDHSHEHQYFLKWRNMQLIFINGDAISHFFNGVCFHSDL